MDFYIFSDGASRGNPGPAAAAAVIYRDSSDSEPILRLGKTLGVTTNNVAEYQGLVLGLSGLLKFLEEAASSPANITLHLRMDSELIVRQLTGQYRVKHEAMKPLFEQAKRLLTQFGTVDIRHVRRELNKEADRLANQHLDGQAPT